MILDKENRFADGQVVTATAISTNVIDLIKSGLNLGAGEEMLIQAAVKAAMTDTGSDSTVTVELVTDSADTMGSPVVVQTIGTFPALSAIGTKLTAKLQPSNAYERYIAVRFTVTGGNLTTGTFDAYLAKDADLVKAYPSGFSAK